MYRRTVRGTERLLCWLHGLQAVRSVVRAVGTNLQVDIPTYPPSSSAWRAKCEFLATPCSLKEVELDLDRGRVEHSRCLFNNVAVRESCFFLPRLGKALPSAFRRAGSI